jgi:hypothetical protein
MSGPHLVPLAASFVAIATVIVALRCYVRMHVRPCFDLDDGLAIASLVIIFLVLSVHSFLVIFLLVFCSIISMELTELRQEFFILDSAFIIVAVQHGGIGQNIKSLSPTTIEIGLKVKQKICIRPHRTATDNERSSTSYSSSLCMRLRPPLSKCRFACLSLDSPPSQP